MFEKLIQKLDGKGLTRQKVYIVPTKKGFKFVFVNFTIFLMALSYSNNMALLIAFLMVAYLIISMLETHKYIQDTIIENVSMSSFFLSHPLNLQIKTKEPLDERAAPVIQLELIGDHENLKSEKGALKSENILKFSLMIFKRGHYKFNLVKLYTRGYANLFYVWRYFPLPTEFFVYPSRRHTTLSHHAESPEKTENQSEAEFKFHIPYAQGLSSKRIDWKVYARTESLYWKKHDDEKSQAVEINYHKLEGEHEEKLEFLSYLIDKNFKEGNAWKLVLPQKVFPFAKGHSHYQTSLENISVL